jgi:hypothetical protein
MLSDQTSPIRVDSNASEIDNASVDEPCSAPVRLRSLASSPVQEFFHADILRSFSPLLRRRFST